MNPLSTTLVVVLLATLLRPGETMAISVSDGCESPSPVTNRKVFYVDPAKGSMSNDGSATRPWSSLAEVLDRSRKLIASRVYSVNYKNGDRKLYDQNPSGPIKSGDFIYLMSGDHGNVQILGAINDNFITVQAAPGQTPRLRSLRVNGASKWIFLGLKVQGAGDGSTNSLAGIALADFGRDLWLGPTDNIIFADGSVSTADDSISWTDLDWVKKPFKVGVASNATCITISGNRFFNLRDAIAVGGERTLIADNKIENFGNDGIDLDTGHVTIRNNTITSGRNTKSETLHADGIQGWTKDGATNRNVTIDRNLVIKTGDPETTYMQGISIFDGKWDGLTITNNVVVTNHWHGIAVYGVANAKIMNNTVVAYDPVKRPTWITVQKAKDGRPSENVIVRNNITTQLTSSGPGVIMDHNIVSKAITTDSTGKPVSLTTPGSYGDHNIINPDIYSTLMKVDHSKGVYDLRLKANSPAIGSGNPALAPATDILGKPRVRPIDIGAYARSN